MQKAHLKEIKCTGGFYTALLILPLFASQVISKQNNLTIMPKIFPERSIGVYFRCQNKVNGIETLLIRFKWLYANPRVCLKFSGSLFSSHFHLNTKKAKSLYNNNLAFLIYGPTWT